MYNVEKLKPCSAFPCSKEIMEAVVGTMQSTKSSKAYYLGYDYTISNEGYVSAKVRGLGYDFYRDLGGQWTEGTDNEPYEDWLTSVQ